MLCSVVFGSPGTWTTTRQAPTSIRSPARLAGGNWLADMQGRPPEMQRGGPRCKNHSCFHHAFGRHAQRRAELQGWPPEMQKPPLHVGLVLPRTTAERSFCISDSHPCMSALLFYYFTILLFYYFTILLFYYFTILLFCYFTILLFHSRYNIAAADVWGWPPEMQKKTCMSARLLFYYFVIALQIHYCRGRCLGLAARDAKTSFCSSDSHPCMSALLTLLFYYCVILRSHSKYSTAAADV